MKSIAVTFIVYAALIVIAGAIVAASLGGEEPKPVAAEVQTGAPAPSPEEGKQVVCAVCGRKHPRDEMHVLAVESLGYAPDSVPVIVCSKECELTALEEPETYRDAAIAERGSAE
jgi:hypothetical protein